MTEQRIFEVIYIKTTLAMLWDALTNPEVTQCYWFDTRIESDWLVGSKVRFLRKGELTDEHTLLAIDYPRHLSLSFHPVFGEYRAEPPSRATLSLEKNGGVVRLTVVHENFPPASKVYRACSDGWPMILSNLKTLLETGAPLPAFTLPPQQAQRVR